MIIPTSENIELQDFVNQNVNNDRYNRTYYKKYVLYYKTTSFNLLVTV